MKVYINKRYDYVKATDNPKRPRLGVTLVPSGEQVDLPDEIAEHAIAAGYASKNKPKGKGTESPKDKQATVMNSKSGLAGKGGVA